MTTATSTPDSPHGEPHLVAAMFGRIARRYDLLNHLLSFGIDMRWRNLMASEAGLRPGDSALDVATGTADSAIVLARQVGASGRVAGLDLTRDMLLVGRVKLAGKEDSPIDLYEGDAMHLPYRDAAFRAATMAFGGRNVPNLGGAFHEMVRVVAPGGRVVFLELNRPSIWGYRQLYDWYFHIFSPLVGGLLSGDRAAYEYLPRSVDRFEGVDEIRELMRAAGLTDVRVRRLALGAAFLHVGRVPEA